jgi:hypothetical protein
MLIIWGKKLVRRRLGYVGDFCPVCRGLECMSVVRLNQVSHLYYIPLGGGEPVAHEITCRKCGSVYGAQGVGYTAFAPRPGEDGVAMAADAGMLDGLSPRAELEDAVAGGRLSPEDRAALIAEPIAALNYMAAQKVGKGMIPTGAGLAIVGLVFTVPGAIIAWATQGTPVEVRLALTGVATALLAGAVLGLRFGGRGWVRRRLIPRLAASLEPLRPTSEELESTLGALNEDGYIIGKRIKAAELAEAVRARSVQV